MPRRVRSPRPAKELAMRASVLNGAILCAATLFLTACPKPAPPESAVRKEPERAAEVLKSGAPTEHLEFDDPAESFPPRPKGYSGFTTVPVTNAHELSTERIAAFRKAALADARVRDALGERYIHLQSGELDAAKPEGADATRPAPLQQLRFYSYTNGNTVDVIFERDDAIRSVEVRKDLQPPESAEEIAAARAIVLEQAKSARALRGLVATGILSGPEAVGLPADGRVIYLTFNTPDNVIKHVAWVDMRNRKLIKDGPPPTENPAGMPANEE
jgi:hypothetical protein